MCINVFDEEPLNKGNQLKNIDNIIFSSHNASNTHEANQVVSQFKADIRMVK